MPNEPKKPALGQSIPADKKLPDDKVPHKGPLHKGPPRDMQQNSLKRNVKPIPLPGKSRGR